MRRIPLIFVCTMVGFTASCKFRSKKTLHTEGTKHVVVANESPNPPPSIPNPASAKGQDETQTQEAVQVPSAAVPTGVTLPAAPVKREGIFGILSRSGRACRKQACGRFALRLLNRVDEVIPLDSISLPNKIDLEQVLSRKIILFGTLKASTCNDQLRSFELKEAFAYAYGNARFSGDRVSFAIISEQVPHRQCYVAPCPNKTADVLNTDEFLLFDRVDWEALAKKDGSIEEHPLDLGPDLIVAGVAADGETPYPGGFERIFNIAAIFKKVEPR